MRKEPRRIFGREFKLAALSRMAAGENVTALARELGIRRKYLYRWRARFRTGGPVALRDRGRPTKAEALVIAAGGETLPAAASAPVPDRASPEGPAREALAKAERRIAELERKIGQQQIDLDFFRQALRQVRQARPQSGTPGGTASTRSSKPWSVKPWSVKP